MTFIWPGMLLLLLLLPLLWVLNGRLRRRRQRFAQAFSNPALMPGAAGARPERRAGLPQVFFLAGLAVLMVALARPQREIYVPRVEGTVVLAFDVSGSMAADDLQPSRMEAAKAAARTFVENQPAGVQIGVVAFSESGLSVQPPTNDTGAILAAINRLSPERGTSLGGGVLAAMKTITGGNGMEELQANQGQEAAPGAQTLPSTGAQYPSAAIVLITDGENTAPPSPFDAAQEAARLGIRIHTVGIGSPTGTILEVNGFTVHTRLDEEMLKQMAFITGGNYYNAQTGQDLQGIYSDLSPQLMLKPEHMELTSLIAGASLLVLLAGGLFSLLWHGALP